MHLFCFGFGYTAKMLARRLGSVGGVSIQGTRTAASGPGDLVFDGTVRSPAVAHALEAATHVLVSIPPDAETCPALRVFGDDLAQSRSLAWVGYLSTVGVYGDHGGGWVDENTPLAPQSERSRRRVLAEATWQAFEKRSGKRVDIFRLSGIYGPGRSAFDQLRAGVARAIDKPGQVFNRIHVDDIVGAVHRAMSTTSPHRLFNVTDDEPAPPQDVIAYASRLIGMSPPPIISFDRALLSPMAASFYAENKRVSNVRMKESLGYTLSYPSYREGLAAILSAERA